MPTGRANLAQEKPDNFIGIQLFLFLFHLMCQDLMPPAVKAHTDGRIVTLLIDPAMLSIIKLSGAVRYLAVLLVLVLKQMLHFKVSVYIYIFAYKYFFFLGSPECFGCRPAHTNSR